MHGYKGLTFSVSFYFQPGLTNFLSLLGDARQQWCEMLRQYAPDVFSVLVIIFCTREPDDYILAEGPTSSRRLPGPTSELVQILLNELCPHLHVS